MTPSPHDTNMIDARPWVLPTASITIRVFRNMTSYRLVNWLQALRTNFLPRSLTSEIFTYLYPYTDWLRAGRSGDRIPMGGEIFRTCPDRP